MGDVKPLRPCRRCGFPARPVDLQYQGETVATVNACGACVEEVSTELARVRPVFDAMIAAGVHRDVANATMTFLLEAEEAHRC